MPNTPWTGLPKVRQAMDYFISLGRSPAQAAGIVAGLQRESGLDEDEHKGDGGNAYGVAEWHQDRRDDFRNWAGTSIQGSPFLKQLEFVDHELTKGSRQKAGHALSFTDTPEAAGEVMSRSYEAPKDADGEAALRAGMARDLFDAYQKPGAP